MGQQINDGLSFLSRHGAFVMEAWRSGGKKVQEGLFCTCQIYRVTGGGCPAELEFHKDGVWGVLRCSHGPFFAWWLGHILF